MGDDKRPGTTQAARQPEHLAAGETPPAGGGETARVIADGIRAVDHAGPIRGRSVDEIVDTLYELTVGLLRLGNIPCRCEVIPDEYHLVKLITDDESAGRLIGRHGAGVDALEYVVDRMAAQAFGERVKLNLDINNYRRKREAAIIERVGHIMMRVKNEGQEEHMEPLCARERRIVHLQVKQASGLMSYTMGGAASKHVVIAPDDGRAREATAEKSGAEETAPSDGDPAGQSSSADAPEIAAEAPVESKKSHADVEAADTDSPQSADGSRDAAGGVEGGGKEEIAAAETGRRELRGGEGRLS
jgi:spoIIIJ-associated protein